MPFLINTNVTALNAANNLGVNSDNLNNDIAHLSSGLRINSAADDAAGLVISNSLSAQDAGITQATRNTNDAINVVKTADSALGQVSTLLTNIRQLVLHAANVGANDPTAAAADKEAIRQAVNSIDRIANTTQFNNKNLLQGNAGTTSGSSTSLTFQIGANGGQTVQVAIGDARSLNLGNVTTTDTFTGADGSATSFAAAQSLSSLGGATPSLDITAGSNGNNAQEALQIVDNAINQVSTEQADLGAVQSNELQTNVQSLATAQTNTESSLSSIRDVDLATEIVDYTKNQILVQAGTSALSQANQAPQAILKLLQ
ncbi:MAG: flagellin [Armatimonadetes bacterium]|nr:flagellin [Armatimonadota bacterium]